MSEVFSISGAAFGRGFGATNPCPVGGWEATPNGNCGSPVATCPPDMRVGGACRNPLAIALQHTVRQLGSLVGDTVLANLRLDGLVGDETTQAVNKALYAYAGHANQRFRTGQLSRAQIMNEAGQITSILDGAVTARGGTVSPPPKLAPTAEPETPVATIVETPRSSRAMLGLLGLSAVAAAAGAYFVFGGKRSRFAGADDELGATFQKRHYEAMASLLCRHGANPSLVRGIAAYFGQDNPRFREDMFVRATETCSDRGRF